MMKYLGLLLLLVTPFLAGCGEKAQPRATQEEGQKGMANPSAMGDPLNAGKTAAPKSK